MTRHPSTHDWTWVAVPASFPACGWWVCRRCGTRASTREIAARELHRTRAGARVPALARRGCLPRLTIELDRETDGRWIAEVLELPGCRVYGRDRADAVARVRALAREIVADECRRPNAETRAAMHELERGGGRHHKDVPSLLADLDGDES